MIKNIAEDYAERVWNKKDLSAIDDHLHSSLIIHSSLGAFNLETAVRDDKVMQDFELESFANRGRHSLMVKAPPIRNDYGSKDCVNLSSPTAVSRFNGPQAMKDIVKTWLKAFPDLNVKNNHVITDHDMVCMHWRAQGTHKGEFKGKNPTGKTVNYSGITLYLIKNEKIIEYWAYLDMQHLLNQI